jgi:hypothetical protein
VVARPPTMPARWSGVGAGVRKGLRGAVAGRRGAVAGCGVMAVRDAVAGRGAVAGCCAAGDPGGGEAAPGGGGEESGRRSGLGGGLRSLCGFRRARRRSSLPAMEEVTKRRG